MTGDALTLYDSRLSGNAWKVRLLLTQLGRPFRRVTFNLPEGKTRTPEFKAKNPVGKVPVIELADGTTLFESNAILIFLARGSKFLPEAPVEQAQVLQWMFFEQSEALKNLAPARFQVSIAKRAKEMAPEIAKWHEAGYKALEILDGRLAAHSFLAADRYTIADIANYPYVSMAHEGAFDMARFSHIASWLDRVRAQPGYVPLIQD
jgi:glutathione S-transferase